MGAYGIGLGVAPAGAGTTSSVLEHGTTLNRGWLWTRVAGKSAMHLGKALHCQVENQVRKKFTTLILYAIDNFKNYDIFSVYTYPLIIFLYIFLKFLVISIFSSNFFSSTVRHSS